MGVVGADELPCYLALRIDYEDGWYGEIAAVNVVCLKNRWVSGCVEHGECNADSISDGIGTRQIVHADGENFGVFRFELVVFSLQIT